MLKHIVRSKPTSIGLRRGISQVYSCYSSSLYRHLLVYFHQSKTAHSLCKNTKISCDMYYSGDMMIQRVNVAETILHEAVYYAGDRCTIAATKCMMVYHL
jgi:hypothetical protein